MPEPQVPHLFEQLTLLHLVGAVLFGLLAWLLLYLLRIAAELLVKKYGNRHTVVRDGLPIAGMVVVVAASLFICFVILSPPVSAPLAISAAVGLALGLGAQELVRNLIAGMVLRFNRTFKVGDLIEANGQRGQVTSLGLTATRLYSNDDRVVTIPNATLLGTAVSNCNAGASDTQVTVAFHLPAGSDLDLLQTLAREVAISSPYVYLKKPVSVLVGDAGTTALSTVLRVKAYVVDIRLEQVLINDLTVRFQHELRIRELSD